MREQIKMRIILLLEKHIRKDISINDFKELITVLDLDIVNKRLADEIIKDHTRKQSEYENNEEFDFLEEMEKMK